MRFHLLSVYAFLEASEVLPRSETLLYYGMTA